MIVDQKSKTGQTSASTAIAALKKAGLKVGLDTFGLPGTQALQINALGFNNFDPNLVNYESMYMTKEEQRRKGLRGTVTASFLLAKSVVPLATVLFGDPVFGKIFLSCW